MKGDRRYAGNHCILYLECRTIGAAARHRCFSHHPAALSPIPGLAHHSETHFRQSERETRRREPHCPHPVPDFFHRPGGSYGNGKHHRRGGGALYRRSGRCLLDVVLCPAGNGADLQRKRPCPALCPDTAGRQTSERSHGISPVRTAQPGTGGVLCCLLCCRIPRHGQHDPEQRHFHSGKAGVFPAAAVDGGWRCSTAGHHSAPWHKLHRKGHPVAHAAAVCRVPAVHSGFVPWAAAFPALC